MADIVWAFAGLVVLAALAWRGTQSLSAAIFAGALGFMLGVAAPDQRLSKSRAAIAVLGIVLAVWLIGGSLAD